MTQEVTIRKDDKESRTERQKVPRAQRKLIDWKKIYWTLYLVTSVVIIIIAYTTKLHITNLEIRLKNQSEMISSIARITKDSSTSKKISLKPVALMWSANVDMKHLACIRTAFERVGYEVTHNLSADWDVMWFHEVPPIKLTSDLKPHQRVNKLPGHAFVTSKVHFSILGGVNIPQSFGLPEDKDQFLKYAKANPNVRFMEKNNQHRFVKLKTIDEIDLDSSTNFVQKFIDNPLLIDGVFFDMGTYVVVTSIDPLRLYRITDDVTFRFCNVPYHPLNASNLDQYVISDNYGPSYKQPALKPYLNMSFPLQESFNAYIQSTGHDPKSIWDQIDESIQWAYLNRWDMINHILSQRKSARNFFEMVRFDFIVDENYKVHVIEANMAPSLSAVEHPLNAKRFEQIAYTTLSIAGLTNYLHHPYQNSKEANEMLVSDRNIMVNQESCLKCDDCSKYECELCAPCLSVDMLTAMKDAYREHQNKYRSVRVFPPRMTQEEAKNGIPEIFAQLPRKSKLLYRWFQARCLMDISWC